jgi:hypothetical protein
MKSPNSSGTLSSFASGAGMQTQQVVFFKEMWEQRLGHLGTGKIMVEEAVQTSTWRGCANSIIPSPASCLVSNSVVSLVHSFIQEFIEC